MDYRGQFMSGAGGQKIQGIQQYVGEFQKANESDQYTFGDGVVDTLSSTMSYAGSGAALGTALGGPVGSAIGAGAGALVGLGIGLFGAFKSDDEAQKQQEAAREYNAKQEAARLEKNALIKTQNEMLIDQFESKTQQENLAAYKSAVSQSNYQFI